MKTLETIFDYIAWIGGTAFGMILIASMVKSFVQWVLV